MTGATTDSPTIAAIEVGDEPESWRAAGFVVDDDGTCRIGRVRIELVGHDRGKRILRWSLRGTTPGTLDTGDLDGIPTLQSSAPPSEPATHPNGTLLIDHIVLATPDGARTTAAFEAAGLRSRRVRETESYGAPMRQTFFTAGEVVVELISGVEPSPAEPATGPAGFFGLAYTVEDLDVLATRLGDHLGTVKDAVQPGRRIATLRHKQLDMSVATAFMSPEPGGAPSR